MNSAELQSIRLRQTGAGQSPPGVTKSPEDVVPARFTHWLRPNSDGYGWAPSSGETSHGDHLLAVLGLKSIDQPTTLRDHASSLRLCIDQSQQHESSNVTPPKSGHPRVSSFPGMLLCCVKRRNDGCEALQDMEDLAGDVAFEAADNLAL